MVVDFVAGSVLPTEEDRLVASDRMRDRPVGESAGRNAGIVWFRRDWLQRLGLDPAQCAVLRVQGEAMAPTIPAGSSILVDRSRTRRRDGQIFVLRTAEGPVVKRAASLKPIVFRAAGVPLASPIRRPRVQPSGQSELGEHHELLNNLPSVLLGGVMAIISAVVTSRIHLKLRREDNAAAHERELLRIRSERERRIHETRMAKTEEAAKLLYRLARTFSKTHSFTTWSTDTSPEEYYQFYWEVTPKLDRLTAIVTAYFPQLRDQVDAFAGAINAYFGEQQGLLRLNQELSVPEYKSQQDQVRDAADNVSERFRELQTGLHREADAVARRLLETL